MITYHQGKFVFFRSLFRVHGSALHRAIIPSLLSTAILLTLEYYSYEPTPDDIDRWFTHPYPIACLMAAFTFLLTFKCSFSYNRYWEACTAIHQMQSKWLDVGMELAAFHLQSERFERIRPKAFGSYPFMDHVVRKRERLRPMTPMKLQEFLREEEEVEEEEELAYDDHDHHFQEWQEESSKLNETKTVHKKIEQDPNNDIVSSVPSSTPSSAHKNDEGWNQTRQTKMSTENEEPNLLPTTSTTGTSRSKKFGSIHSIFHKRRKNKDHPSKKSKKKRTKSFFEHYHHHHPMASGVGGSSSSSSDLISTSSREENKSINNSKHYDESHSLAAGVFNSKTTTTTIATTTPVTPIQNYNSTKQQRQSKRRLSKFKSIPDLSGGMSKHKTGPSLFLQEASHLLSLLSAVSFATLRNDIESAESPLKEYIPGTPWPPVDPDAKDANIHFENDDNHDFYHSPRWRVVWKYIFGNNRTPAQRTIYNACRPFAVLGGVSDAEIDVLQRARGPLAKTALCTMWLQEFISREYLNGALGKVAAPIISRLFQYTSDGMIGYNQARKVCFLFEKRR